MNFKDFHPLSLIVYFISVISFTMITRNPILLLCSFLGGIASVYFINRKTDLKIYLIIFVMVAVTNPLFSHNGETVLFYLFDQRITLEAFVYGIGAGMLIVSIIYWFKLFSIVFTEDKLAWILGKIAPKLCVVFCMALRFVPLFKQNAVNIYNAQLSLGIFDTTTIKGKLKMATNVFSALISLSIENAIETADTMQARGYGNNKRSSYSLVLVKKFDIAFTLTVLIADLLIALLILNNNGNFYYYPAIKFEELNVLNIALYIGFALLCILPVIIHIVEDLKWKYLISKI